jgi:hypothetical protein
MPAVTAMRPGAAQPAPAGRGNPAAYRKPGVADMAITVARNAAAATGIPDRLHGASSQPGAIGRQLRVMSAA